MLQAFPRVWSQFCPWARAPQGVAQVPQNFDMSGLCPQDFQPCLHAHWLPLVLLSQASPSGNGPKETLPQITAWQGLEPVKLQAHLEASCLTMNFRGRSQR